MRINEFVWNGTNCNKYKIIVVDPFPSYVKAKKRTKSINVSGVSGSLYINSDEYEEKEITLNCVCMDKSQIDNIKQWLDGTGELILGTLANRKYKAEIIDGMEFNSILTRVNYTFKVKFMVEPYLYAITDEVIEITQNNTNINNHGNVPTSPTMRIYGNGDVAIMINNNMLEIKGIKAYVDVDGILGVYKGNVSYDNVTSGEFPIMLDVGENEILYSDNVNKIEMKTNIKYL